MKYIEVNFPNNELLPYLLGEIGFESFIEDGNRLLAYIQEKDFSEEAIRQITLADVGDFTWKQAEYKDWNEEWEREGFDPIVIDNKIIIHDLIHPIDATSYNYNIVIDAKLSFGTGTHDTTQMMLRNLLKTFGNRPSFTLSLSKGLPQNLQPTTNNPQPNSILDCGCGTGILSIAASKMGADNVVGYDIDEWSVTNSRHNADLNGISDIRFHLGDASLIGTEITGTFDVVMANINRNILIADVEKFVSVMHTGSHLIVSGFYTSDSEDIIAAFAKHGLNLVRSLESQNWQSLVFER